MMEKIVIVCDLPDHHLGNKIFSDETQKAFPWGESFWPMLKSFIESRGWEIVTSDIYLDQLARRYSDYKVFLISYMQTSKTRQLLRTNAVPLIVYSLESPNIALRFYSGIRAIASRYKHTVVFRGVSNIIPGSHVLYWPNTIKKVLAKVDWDERQFLCMIASNKNQFTTSPEEPHALLRSLRRRIALPLTRLVAPFMKSEDQYGLRLQAINYFSSRNLSLFGTGWHEQRSIDETLYEKIKRLKPRKVDDKIQTLKEFKYCICFENCRFPGYITEKIFDSFFAGVVPIYMGAPDIEDFIPKDCFIHFENYKDFSHLYEYLLSMDRKTHDKYLYAASTFLASENFRKYTDVYMAEKFYQIIQSELQCVDPQATD